MMKKTLVTIIAVLAIVLIGLRLIGISPAYIYHAPTVATSMGAKLLCSAEYVIGNERDQAFQDLALYSPILAQLSVNYDDTDKAVTADLFGLKETSARFIPNIGCAVDYAGFDTREQLKTKALVPSKLAWPSGNTVNTIEPKLQGLLEAIIDRDNEAGLNTRALLVVHNGAIKAEAYAQGMHKHSPLIGWSMTKSLMAVMLGNLEMRGLLDLNQIPGFSAWSDDARKDIKIVDLLNMTDGLDFSERYDPSYDAVTMLFDSPSTSDYVLKMKAKAEPGKYFNYSSGTSNLLSRIHMDTLGSPQKAYDNYYEAIAIPMGFQNAIFETDASGVFVGSSYLYASARDWARLGQLMLNQGELNGHRIVTEGWVSRALTPNASENEKSYGYQWWLNKGDEQFRYADLPEDMFYASGNRKQIVMVFPSFNAVIVRLGWTVGNYPTSENFIKILDAL